MSIHFSLRFSAFAASVITLSWFFAGVRQVMASGKPGDWALLAAGTALTLALLFLQGYWIYFDEKGKGSLKKRIALFEKIHCLLEAWLQTRAPRRGRPPFSSPTDRDGARKQ